MLTASLMYFSITLKNFHEMIQQFQTPKISTLNSITLPFKTVDDNIHLPITWHFLLFNNIVE